MDSRSHSSTQASKRTGTHKCAPTRGGADAARESHSDAVGSARSGGEVAAARPLIEHQCPSESSVTIRGQNPH